MAKKPKAQPIDHRVIVHDGFDEMAFENVEHYERIQEITSSETPEDSKLAKDLVQDVFTSFYRTEPQIEEEKKSLTKDVMSELLNMKEHKDFHQTSMLDGVASALGSIQMSPILLEKLKEIQEQIEQQRQQQREKNKQDGKDENDGVPDGDPSLDEMSDEGKSELRQSMREAIDKAQKENEDIQSQMRQWGVDKGEYQKMDAQARLELADRLKQAGKLKDVSQLVGRFKNVVTATLATTPSHGSDEIVDIGLGDDIARMVPSESMKLVNNPLLFFKDMLEKNLLVYNLRGTENLGKGPLMVCFDISGSMMGGREAWAKAVVLSLLAYAQQEKRSFAWVAFESRVHDSAFYPKNTSIPLDEKIKLAEMATLGGTNFWEPLKECMDLHKQETELRAGDIIFITDGECGMHDEQIEEFAKWKKEKDVRVFGVGITDMGGSHWEKASFESLDEFCDQVCMVNDKGDVSALRQAVQMAHKRKDDQ